MDTLLTAPDSAPEDASGKMRLGFPSSDQLARFVAGQHGRLLGHLGLPAPLRLIGGGHLERKRFFASGRVSAPDVVLSSPEGHLVLVFAISPVTEPLRLPDPTALDVVTSLGHDATGVLITPDPSAEMVERIEESLARFGPETPMHWVRYRIDLEIIG
ncbi:MAG: hypothetical protein HKN46_07955 [Acidimicrobiia bacterium]|nr:hypothetical protein [Acidimicrobiia bacterium]